MIKTTISSNTLIIQDRAKQYSFSTSVITIYGSILPAVKLRGSNTLRTSPTVTSEGILSPCDLLNPQQQQYGAVDPGPVLAQRDVRASCGRRRGLGAGGRRRHAPVPSSGNHRQAERQTGQRQEDRQMLAVSLSVQDQLAHRGTAVSLCPAVSLPVCPQAEGSNLRHRSLNISRLKMKKFIFFFSFSFFFFVLSSRRNNWRTGLFLPLLRLFSFSAEKHADTHKRVFWSSEAPPTSRLTPPSANQSSGRGFNRKTRPVQFWSKDQIMIFGPKYIKMYIFW